MGLFSRRRIASSSVGTAKMVLPDAPWVSAVDLEHTFRLQMSWDLVLNFAAKDLNYKFPVKAVPLKGEWSVQIHREQGEVRVSLRYGTSMPAGLLGTRIATTLTLCWTSSDGQQQPIHWGFVRAKQCPGFHNGSPTEGMFCLINASKWTEASRVSGGAFVPATHRLYRLSITLEQKPSEDAGVDSEAPAEEEDGTRELAKRLTELNLKQVPHDVCLRFPGKQGSPELWTTSDLLSCSSPYFIDLFSSDFAESELRTGSRDGEDEPAEQVVVEKDFDDSDDETDEILFSKRPHLLKPTPATDALPFRQITITQTSFSTYHAVLIYLQTGYIDFAPLYSFSSSSPVPRARIIAEALTTEPSLPAPVSPKSVFRLAHLLQLNDLQKRSLDAFRSSLSNPSTLVQELFSDTALAYDDLRAVVVDVIRAKWNEVKKTEAWKEKRKVVRGKGGTQAEKEVLLEVLDAVST